MRRFQFILALLLPLLSFPESFALSAIESHHFTLKNGLKIVVIPQHRVPAVAHILMFRAGSSDDVPGHSGVAHYLEHMLFKGTARHPEGDYDKIIAGFGGTQNAFTSRDMTAYYAVTASEHLERIMDLESDRFMHWKADQKTIVSERDVITEERRTRVDNNPDALLGEAMLAAMYRNHPYHTPLIGWMHEMQTLGVADLDYFYRGYYSPDNAILLLVGDIAPEKAKALAEKYYKNWKKTPLLPRAKRDEPPRLVEQTVTLRHPEVRQPSWSRSYDAPSILYGDSTRMMPLIVLAQVLGGGRTSLLYQSLVVEQKLATEAGADYSGYTIGPSPFQIGIVPAEGVAFGQIDATYRKVTEEVKQNGIDAASLERAKNLLKSASIYSRDGLERLAFTIGQLYMLGKDETWLETWPEMVNAVTSEDIRQAARLILNDDLATTGLLLPEGKTDAAKP